MPDPKNLSAAEVARLIDGKVRVPKLDKMGQPIVNKGVIETEERRIAAADIIGFRQYDNRIIAVTVDGQKLEAALR